MIRALLILAMLLTVGCASQPKQRPANYGGQLTAENVCVIVENQLVCVQSATEAQRVEWVAYHTHPVTDACEQKANKRIRRYIAADYASTGAGLVLCTLAFEANPIGLIPAIVLTEATIRSDRKRRAQSSRWDENRFDDSVCTRDGPESAAMVRGVMATGNNVLVTLGCVL